MNRTSILSRLKPIQTTPRNRRHSTGTVVPDGAQAVEFTSAVALDAFTTVLEAVGESFRVHIVKPKGGPRTPAHLKRRRKFVVVLAEARRNG